MSNVSGVRNKEVSVFRFQEEGSLTPEPEH
jgi:hypothetical protein